MNDKQKLVEKSKLLEPISRIGKSGLTEGVIKELKRQLKVRKLIKVKFLKAALEGKKKKEFAKEIAMLTESELIHQVGFVGVYWKR